MAETSRIEWAHRWADADFQELTGNGGIAAAPVNANGTCKYEHGAEVEHVWRRVSGWETGEPPDLAAETAAGTPENLRALYRLLKDWERALNDEIPGTNDWLADALAQAAYRLRKVRAWD